MIVLKSARLRRVLGILLPAVLLPAAAVLAALLLPARRWFIGVFAMVLLSLLFFLTGFERRRCGARRMVLVAVMAALCVVSRFLPIVKPVAALIILAGLWLGGEAGFLTGALAAVLSNLFFGQGPWTAFQMLAWGLIGLFAGLLAPCLRAHRAALLCYGAAAGILFSLVMDVWTALWANGSPDFSVYLASVVSAAPFTLLYALSNTLFLALFARPFGRRMERMVRKYDL